MTDDQLADARKMVDTPDWHDWPTEPGTWVFEDITGLYVFAHNLTAVDKKSACTARGTILYRKNHRNGWKVYGPIPDTPQ